MGRAGPARLGNFAKMKVGGSVLANEAVKQR